VSLPRCLGVPPSCRLLLSLVACWLRRRSASSSPPPPRPRLLKALGCRGSQFAGSQFLRESSRDLSLATRVRVHRASGSWTGCSCGLSTQAQAVSHLLVSKAPPPVRPRRSQPPTRRSPTATPHNTQQHDRFDSPPNRLLEPAETAPTSGTSCLHSTALNTTCSPCVARLVTTALAHDHASSPARSQARNRLAKRKSQGVSALAAFSKYDDARSTVFTPAGFGLY
jgi:hypothetical protein